MVRRSHLLFTYWTATDTYVTFGLHQFILMFYWTGDFDVDIIPYTNHWKLYFFLVFIYAINLLFYYIIFHGMFYYRNAMYDTTFRTFAIIHSIFKKFITINVSSQFGDFLKKQWYHSMLNYNNVYKCKFLMFLRITSIILIVIHMLFIASLLFSSYYFFHYWVTELMILFEYNFYYSLIIFLKLLFIYNLYISIFLSKTNFWWFFLFWSYENDEEAVRVWLMDHGIQEAVNAYSDSIFITVRDPLDTIRSKLMYGRPRAFIMRDPRLKLVMFNKAKYLPIQYAVPQTWHNWRRREVDCIITSNYYFSYTIFIKKNLHALYYPGRYFIDYYDVVVTKKLPRRIWTQFHIRNVTYYHYDSYKKNKKKYRPYISK